MGYNTAPNRLSYGQQIALGTAAWAAALGLAVVGAWLPWTGHLATSTTTGGTTVQAPAQAQAADGTARLATAVNVTGSEFTFAPATIQAPAGQAVTFTFENRGVIQHDFVIQAADFMLDAAPGETVSGELTLAQPGTYALTRSIPGHKEAGMRGTLQVVSASTPTER